MPPVCTSAKTASSTDSTGSPSPSLKNRAVLLECAGAAGVREPRAEGQEVRDIHARTPTRKASLKGQMKRKSPRIPHMYRTAGRREAAT